MHTNNYMYPTFSKVLYHYTNAPAQKFKAHCNTLQHTATHCNTLQHTATHYVPTQILLHHSVRDSMRDTSIFLGFFSSMSLAHRNTTATYYLNTQIVLQHNILSVALRKRFPSVLQCVAVATHYMSPSTSAIPGGRLLIRCT